MAPATLLPPSLEGWPVAAVSHDLDDVLDKADVVSLLRVQSERGSGEFVPTLREYTAGYGLTARRAAMLQPEAVILHPGPDRPGGGDRLRRGRAARLAHHRAGEQRGGHPDGRALPPARPGAGRGGPPWLSGADRRRSARPTVVIRGGTVVDQTGERRADVLVVGGPGGRGGRRDRRPAGGPGARRRRLRGGPRPGRPAHPSPPARARGVRDHRDRDPGGGAGRVHRGGGHAQHRAGRWTRPRRSATCSSWPPRPPPRWRWPGPSPWAGPASGWPRWPSWPTSGCACSPTTAPGCSRPG